eukprot:TRINITY_DN13416_c0_g1_i1.p1 TRINITY_DN13416_c0_g1~~TRINITY_DN13416_c0_g1_i1.p1  ORF type:complete len:323 (-),score=100.85 TRINITY_DN13416_c0_g1_i1:48-1016(-)
METPVASSSLSPASAANGSAASGKVHVVVQRCAKARLLVDAKADEWVEVGRGLVVYVSFGQSAAEGDYRRTLRLAAKSLLTAPLSTADEWQADHSDAESLIALCRRGLPQSVLIVPQASLVSKLELGERNVKYHQQCAKDDARKLFEAFSAALERVARELVCPAAQSLDRFNELQAKRAAAALLAPDQFFRVGEHEGKYSQYDERGVPTHDAAGEPLAKSALKKLEKLYGVQVKKYEKATASNGAPDGATSGAAGAAAGGYPSAAAAAATPAAEKEERQEDEAELGPVPDGMCLPEVRRGTFGGRQGFELTTSGPFTHAFVF